jgi:hypothetical protein
MAALLGAAVPQVHEQKESRDRDCDGRTEVGHIVMMR